MHRSFSPLIPGFVAVLAIFLLGAPARAFTESYCSSQNTAADNTYYNWPYQSNGNCTNHCNTQVQASYAFAIIKWEDCWCSNYIPRQQTNINRCAKDCPGFPDENCGSKEDNLFIYLQLNGQPSGTAGGGSQPTSAIVSSAVPPSSNPAPAPSPSTKAQTPSSAPPQTVISFRPPSTTTVVRTVVGEPPPVSSVTSSSSSSTSNNKPSSTPQNVQSSATAQASVQIVTESGVVITKTIVQTPSGAPPSASSAPIRTESDDDGPNVGAIAGGAVGGVLALVAIVGGILFVLWRRRQKQRQMHDALNSAGIGGGSTGITRNTSTMSQAGLLGRGAGMSNQYPPVAATNFSTANSRYGDQESISPLSNRRNSQPLVIDSRLNPKAVLTFANTNASRDSLASMDDSRDYGRQLNVRNPDP